MRIVLTLFLCIVVSVPAFAGPPANGTYTSTDIGGSMLPGRYSESWFPTKLSVNNTLDEASWNGTTLATQWHWYCPWVALPPVLLVNTVNGSGNGQKIWKVTYSGGYCWLDGAGPWAGGDAVYTANINTWTAIVTETYSNFIEVGTVRNHDATATFNGYNQDCMSLSVTNAEKFGDSNSGALPANFPDLLNWIGCVTLPATAPGEWGDVDGITFTVFGCTPLATQPTTWGAVKSKYRN
ncbi:MAG TPA: hypothetical protein VJS69_00985 [Candidatus Krumholzibacteria bacterium]|nr:hypothetical protein [Candidatus Krumholzibacteria bacterium]